MIEGMCVVQEARAARLLLRRKTAARNVPLLTIAFVPVSMTEDSGTARMPVSAPLLSTVRVSGLVSPCWLR